MSILTTQCRLGRAMRGAILEARDQGRFEVVLQTPNVEERSSDASALDPQAWLKAAAAEAPKLQPLGPSRVVPAQPPGANAGLYGGPMEPQVAVMSAGRSPIGAPRVEAFVIQPDDERDLLYRVRLLEVGRTLFDLHRAQSIAEREAEKARRLAGVVETIEAYQAVAREGGEGKGVGHRGSAMAWCNELSTRFDAERVSMGFLSGRYVRLKAMSQTEHLHRRMQAVQDVESTMEECLDQDLEVLHPCPPDSPIVARAAAELSKKHGPSAVLSLPIRDAIGEPRGVVTLERNVEQPFTEDEVATLRLLCNLATPRILELHENDRWFGARWAISTRRYAAKALGPQHTWAKLGAIAALLFFVFAFGFRGTDWVEGGFVVEPVVARTIPAPWDGYLAEVYVEPGDPVVAGETVLARLDTSEVRLELAQARAEEAQHRTQADLAWREGKQAERMIALARARQSAAQVELLEFRLSQANLVAPITGEVTQGDLKKELGQPVEVGQPLFEVAPLASLRGVMRVPEHRVFDVRVGQRGELATASHPGQKLPFVVERVYPVAEVVDQANVFKVRIVPVPTDDAEDPATGATRFDAAWLQPGVEGVAKADAGRAPYAWLWTRAAVNWVRMKLWW